MKRKLLFQLFFLGTLALLSLRAQGQVVRYRNGGPNLWTAAQVDSLIEVMNEKGKSRGFTFVKYVKNTVTRPDTIIYEYTLYGEPTRVAQEARQKELLAFVGKPLPTFALSDVAGKTVTSKALSGKPVVINMWFTTCGPCIAEMPVLNRIQSEKAQAGVVFLAITYQSREQVQFFLKHHPFAFRHLVGAQPYCDKFTTGYPISIFVDKQGVVRNVLGAITIKYDPTTNKVVGADDAEFYAALRQIE